ncbi:WEB family protein At5g16730, chloroplastic-like [Nicotiana sylvestris]|uniref:WEB family protein At5g16730, chloroplastic-like n=1 Tax=Nicotiana sylvestris TaxID=4096 RepID=UPI00388CC3EC
MCDIGPDEYNRVSACDTAKEIWEALQTAYEGTTQVKQSKIDMLTTKYELFRMKDDESIQDIHTRFTSIINELHSLGDVIPRNKLVRKILSVLSGSWESKALAAWGDSSSESERESNAENSSMMAVETEATKYDSLFALMAQSDDDDEEDEDDESLVNDKEILTIELGETKQSRDDLAVCVVDLNETIANLEQEKEVLNENITSAENERDDLMVVVVDLKETIQGLSNEKHILEEKVASIEEERDDLLVICIDLEETIEGLNREHRNVSLGKGKEVAMRGSKLRWTMDSGCLKHAAENIMNCFSLKALQEGNEGSPWEMQCKRASEGILLGNNPQNKDTRSRTKEALNGRRFSWGTLKESPEKEAACNTMAISAKSLMNEGTYLSSEYQGEDMPFLGDVRTTALLESLAHEIFSKKPSDEADSLPCKLTPTPLKSKRSIKTRRKSKMFPKDFIKSVSVNRIAKDASREPGSIVQQSMMIKETGQQAGKKSLPKGLANKKGETIKEPGSTRSLTCDGVLWQQRLRTQKVLWGRTFDPAISEMTDMRQILEIVEFQQ